MPPKQSRCFSWDENDCGEIKFYVHSPVRSGRFNYNIILEGQIRQGNDLPWRVSFDNYGLNYGDYFFGPAREFSKIETAKKWAIRCIKEAIKEFHKRVRKDMSFSRRTKEPNLSLPTKGSK